MFPIMRSGLAAWSTEMNRTVRLRTAIKPTTAGGANEAAIPKLFEAESKRNPLGFGS